MFKKGFSAVMILLCIFLLPALGSAAVLWDQSVSSTNTQAYYSQNYTGGDESDMWLADDFVNTTTWNISKIFVPGDFRRPADANTLANAVSLNWEIYADGDKKPDGDPSGRGNDPFWKLSVPPTDSRVVLSNGTSGYLSNATLNLTTPVSLPPGKYWLIFYPEMAADQGVYGRQPSDAENTTYRTRIVQPLGGDGFPTDWSPASDWSWSPSAFPIPLTQDNFSFRLEGTVGATSGQTLSDPRKIVAGDNLYADFGTEGIWKYDGSAWSNIAGRAEDIVAGGTLLYGDFGPGGPGFGGIWRYDGSTWTQITRSNPEGMVKATVGFYGDFGPGGVWKWDGTDWTQITGSNPEALAAVGTTLYGDFGPGGPGFGGIWKYDGSAWTQVTQSNPEALVGGGTDLYGDFGPGGPGFGGIWKYDGSAWTQITGSNPQGMAAGGTLFYGDFGPGGPGFGGIWRYDGSAWTQLTQSNPEGMAKATVGFYGDFGPGTYGGIWKWDGTAWAQITPIEK